MALYSKWSIYSSALKACQGLVSPQGQARHQAEQELMQEIEDHLAGLDDDQTPPAG